MPITRLQDITRDAIGDWSFSYFKPETITVETPQIMELEVQIILSNGGIERVTVRDLITLLQEDAAGQAHLANLVDFRNYIQARLEAELLPL